MSDLEMCYNDNYNTGITITIYIFLTLTCLGYQENHCCFVLLQLLQTICNLNIYHES